MKKTLLIILSILIISCSKNDKPILKDFEIVGGVKSFKQIYLKPNKSNSNYDTISIENSIFDKDNKKIKGEIRFFFQTPGLKISSDLIYNSKGNFIKEKSVIYKPDNDISEMFIELIYLNDKLNRVESFMKEMNDVKKQIIQIEKIIYKNGTISKSIERDFEIDEKINDTVCVKTTQKKYDKNERIIEIEWNTSDNELGKFEFIRNPNGLVTETKIYKNNNREFEISEYRYEFDKKGNWIIKSKYISDTLVNIKKRIINYK